MLLSLLIGQLISFNSCVAPISFYCHFDGFGKHAICERVHHVIKYVVWFVQELRLVTIVRHRAQYLTAKKFFFTVISVGLLCSSAVLEL